MRVLAAVVAVALLGAAPAPRLDDVVSRVGHYVEAYETGLANVVAEEAYRQHVRERSGRVQDRTLRSDYALTRATDRHVWIGYRDTFEVDGRPVRDREERLQRLLSTGAIAQAEQITEQNARFNLASDALSRTVNVPTFAVELLHPRTQDRFSHRRIGTEAVNGRVAWLVEFRERERPTIVRTPTGTDQATRIVALVSPSTGEVFRTAATWEHVTGSIVVTYGHVAAIPMLVPLTMSERFTTRNGTQIEGDASYADYRRFETSGRLLDP